MRAPLAPALLVVFLLQTGLVSHVMAAPQVAGEVPAVAALRVDAPLVALDGPPAPTPPAVINRDDEGRATLRAVRIQTPLTVDGRLDEAVYLEVPGASDWVQVLPQEG